jgi:hypothetical protein
MSLASSLRKFMPPSDSGESLLLLTTRRNPPGACGQLIGNFFKRDIMSAP